MAEVDQSTPLAHTDTAGHRRLLVGDLVVRRVTYASVTRVSWPFFAALYATATAVAVVAWNIAALAGWSPHDHGVDGITVIWAVVAAGVVFVPVAVAVALGVAALYNAVSRRTGGLEIAVVSPRHHRRLPVDR